MYIEKLIEMYIAEQEENQWGETFVQEWSFMITWKWRGGNSP